MTSILRRLKNLWIISEWEIPKIGEKNEEIGTRFSHLMKKPEKVKILRKEPNLEDLIKKTDE